MEYLITLVHGTFAPNAQWTNKDSDFCSKIRDGLFPDTVTFKHHVWSGKNSHLVRLTEVDNLKENLKRQLFLYPHYKKIIIAHSHGGNIALHALDKLGSERDRFSLITMATPFLNFKKRNFIKYSDIYAPAFAFAVIAIPYFILLKINDDFFYSVNGLLILGLCVIIGQIYLQLKKRIKNVLEQLDYVVEDLCYNLIILDSINNYKILSLVDNRDEVKIWFGTLIHIWESPLNIHNLLSRLTPIAYKLLVIFLIWLLIDFITIIFGEPYGIVWYFLFYVLLFFLGTIFLLFVLTIVLPVILLIIKSNPLAVGWEPLIHQIFIKTKSTIIPIGIRNVELIKYKIKKSSLFSLRHSLYNNDKVCHDIIEWIKAL